MNIEPKNKEQQLAIERGLHFLEHGNSDEWFALVGKAGTGKTTIAEVIIKKFYKKKNVLVCALSHKAKLVITEKLIAAFGANSITSKSVAGALGMVMDLETGEFVIDKNSPAIPPIKKADYIFVDECSMINEEAHELIMREKKEKAKVFYLGDIRQLPPIRKQDSPHVGKPSPTFYTENRVALHERIRQGEESPILPFADYFGDNSRVKHPHLNPVPEGERHNSVSSKGALVFANNFVQVIDVFLPMYQLAVEKKNMNLIKTVAYRNKARIEINNLVRELMFGRSAPQIVVGELLMFSDNFSLPNLDEPISNSYEIQVNKVETAIDHSYNCWRIEFIYEAKPVSVLVLDATEIKRHAEKVSQLFAKAKAMPFGFKRSEALAEAWSLKKRYAPVEYAYAITSHKSQGSTYNTVIVEETDIMGVKPITNKEKSQSLYTSITRGAKTCVMIDGSQANQYLQQAFQFSVNAITA